jgi:4'-phosphopantetheinyl transferase
MLAPQKYSANKNHLLLPSDDVHVWKAQVPAPDHQMHSLINILSTEEKQRANRLVFEKDRNRFISTRGLLRTLLANYLSRNPEELELRQNESGKPFLIIDGKPSELQFNISHSHEVALLAFAYQSDVGVDIELVRENFPIDEIAQRFFSKHEYQALAKLSGREKLEAFFKMWACKEACLKAFSKGIWKSLHEIEITNPLKPFDSLEAYGSENSNKWAIFELNADPEYTAALVVCGRVSGIKFWTYE